MRNAVPDALLRQAVEDAAQQADVDPARVRIMHAEPVTWPDASLGCPDPGMAYPQRLIHGYWIVLAVGEVTFDYRAGVRGKLRRCDRPHRHPPLPPQHI